MNFLVKKKVWIVGASEGIGLAIFKKIQPVASHVFVSSRNAQKLQKIKKSSKNTSIHAVDVCDYDRFYNTAKHILNNDCDTVIYCVGYYKPTDFNNYNLTEQLQTIDVNLKSFLYFIDFIKKFKHCLKQIIVLASSASYIGLPGSFAYGASKAALVNCCECLQTELPSVKIQIVNCGFVRSRLTKQNNFSMPMIMSAEKAAEKIIKNMESAKFEITFPKIFIIFLKILRILPYRLYFKLVTFFIFRKS